MERSEHPCPDMGIDGVSFQPLKVITTPGGPVMHMLRPDSPLRPHAETADGELHLGEVYFSEVLPGFLYVRICLLDEHGRCLSVLGSCREV